jgi:hypothetical protein
LNKAGIDFICCDKPPANGLTIQILAAVAENEAPMISQRKKDALKAYRAVGRGSKRIRAMYQAGVPSEIVEGTAGKLLASLAQCRNLTAEARQRGAKNAARAHRDHAYKAYWDLLPEMQRLRIEGLALQAIADRLNEGGHATRRQKPRTKMQVARALDRSGRQNV